MATQTLFKYSKMWVDLYEMKSEVMSAFQTTSESSAVEVSGGQVNRLEKAEATVCCDFNSKT